MEKLYGRWLYVRDESKGGALGVFGSGVSVWAELYVSPRAFLADFDCTDSRGNFARWKVPEGALRVGERPGDRAEGPCAIGTRRANVPL